MSSLLDRLPYNLRPKFNLRSALDGRKKLFLALTWYRMFGVKDRVYSNSIPKSGTHLLTRCLSLFPGLVYSGFHINDVWDTYRQDIPMKEGTLKRLGKGCIATGHMAFTEAGLQCLQRLGYRHVVMIRDPRDVVVSQYFDVMKFGVMHRWYAYLTSISNDEERMMAVIKGAPDEEFSDGIGILGVKARFEQFLPWIEHGSYLIRFENLIGEAGGGHSDLQLAEIKGLAEHLGIELSASELKTIAGKVYYRKANTFRKGEIGDWRNHFTEKHKAEIKSSMGELLVNLGYEQDLNW